MMIEENDNRKEWSWLTGRSVTPPRLHNVGHEAAHAMGVVFRRAPSTVQFNCDSILSVNDHIYADLVGDVNEG